MSDKMETLKQEAEDLGIKVDGRWSEAKLQEEIDAKLGEDAPEVPEVPEVQDDKPKSEGVKLLNAGKRKHMIASTVLEPGESIELTAEELENEMLMAKVKMSIKCGVLVEVE